VHHEVLTYVKSVGAAGKVGISCRAVLALEGFTAVRDGSVICHLANVTFGVDA
jgi:hypothetical protein